MNINKHIRLKNPVHGFFRIICIVAMLYTWNSPASLAQKRPAKYPNQSSPDAQLIQPADLVKLLKLEKDKRPLILQVGVLDLYNQGHIPGSEYVGPASDPNGLQKLRKRVEKLSRDKFIVLYCGCCPWKDCPNIKPAHREMEALGFSNTKMLNLPRTFKSDWIARGYPVEVEK